MRSGSSDLAWLLQALTLESGLAKLLPLRAAGCVPSLPAGSGFKVFISHLWYAAGLAEFGYALNLANRKRFLQAATVPWLWQCGAYACVSASPPFCWLLLSPQSWAQPLL